MVNQIIIVYPKYFNNIKGEKMKKKFKKEIHIDRDIVNDIELATYIDARERYDELLRQSEQSVINDCKKKDSSE